MTKIVENQASTVSEAFLASLVKLTEGERVYTCIQCGMCAGACPFGPWMEFTPRKMIASLRAGDFDRVRATNTIWMCVSCSACAAACPSQIPLLTALLTRIKEELLLAGNIPVELQTAMENTQRYGNPMGESARKRSRWAQGLHTPVTVLSKEPRPVDVLWFVGDFASYHPRVQQSTRDLARVLQALGVDFGILGPEEFSDGDSQRLAGERGLFEMLAEKNGRTFEKYQFREIITADPHAYNAIKNEYPSLGYSFPVRHYTQFLAERLDDLLPLLIQEINAEVAFHDPCYLGRVNGIFEEPRAILEAIPGITLVEMAHTQANSLCCGGGGGGMWLDGFQWEIAQNRLSEWRVREAVLARPDTSFLSILDLKPQRKRRQREDKRPEDRILAVACPYEIPRFEDAVKVVREASNLQVRDIAELLVQAMGEEKALS